MSNPIIKRSYYAVDVCLISPLNITNGEDYYTDADLLKDGFGEYFVPGSSLAGAFRNYLGTKKDKESIYGFSAGQDGKMSSVFVSDLYLKDAQVDVRDHVKLTPEKTVDNKFDMQIIETGATGSIYIEVVERQNSNYNSGKIIADVIQAIHSGEIRIGADKNRGLGRLEVKQVGTREFFAKDLEKWEKFIALAHDSAGYPEKVQYKTWVEKVEKPKPKYVKIIVPLKLKGGISIRKYSAQKNRPDYEHVTCNGKPVIPGSSWNGAIRSDAYRILKELGYHNASEIIDRWFGFVREQKERDRAQASQSLIVFGESILENAQALPITRNRIDRFTGGIVSMALYSEYSYFGGETDLEIFIKRDQNFEYEEMMGLILLVLMDLNGGYISVGGLGSIGRGIFSLRHNKSWKIIDEREGVDQEMYMKALYRIIKGGA